MTNAALHPVNVAVFFAYLVGMVTMGMFFSRRNHTSDDYFRGGGKLPWWAVSLSIYATMFSSITFLSVPAMVYHTDMRYFSLSFGIGLNYNIIPRHFAKICELCAKNDFRAAAKWQAEANRLVDLVVDSFADNWSAFKVLMKGVGIDCGACRAPYAPLTPAEERKRLRRFAALNLC